MLKRKDINRFLNLVHFLRSPWIIGVLFVLVNIIIGLVVIPKFGYDTADNITWQLASAYQFPPKGSYSPLPSLLVQFWQTLFGTGSTSAFFFHFILFGFSFVLIWSVSTKMFENTHVGVFSLYLVIFSPYLIWSIYIGRDVALDVFGVSLMMFFASRIYYSGHARYIIGFALSGALATSLRETNLVVFLSLLGFLGFKHSLNVRRFLLTSGVFILSISPLLIWNYTGTGTIVLSTRLGINMYYGNHPYYLEGHPRYDIDGFVSKRVIHDYGNEFMTTLNRTERNQAYKQLAIKDIIMRPMETIYRMLLKGFWWVGPTRVPGSDMESYLQPDEDVIVLVGGQSVVKELLYVIHRVIVLVAVVYYWKYTHFSIGRAVFLLLPTLAMTPVAMLTFPDTRFRLAFDPYMYILAAAGLVKLKDHLMKISKQNIGD